MTTSLSTILLSLLKSAGTVLSLSTFKFIYFQIYPNLPVLILYTSTIIFKLVRSVFDASVDVSLLVASLKSDFVA